ncbi:hypothetical protein [Alsobacter sp. R-9]
MSDAQWGLVVTAPIIIGFAIALRRMGVLPASGAVVAVAASVAIAATLFLTQ